MAPFNVTGDVISPLMHALNNSANANDTTITARDPSWTDIPTNSTHKNNYKTTAAITAIGLILGIIFVYLVCRCMARVAASPEHDPPMPLGHVHGQDNASSHALRPMGSDWSFQRPTFQEIEDRASGYQGSEAITVPRPAPAVNRASDRQDASPPPPCK